MLPVLTNAFNPDALTEWVTGVSRQTRADGPHGALDAVCADAACVRAAGHSSVGDGATMLVQVSPEVASSIVVIVALCCK